MQASYHLSNSRTVQLPLETLPAQPSLNLRHPNDAAAVAAAPLQQGNIPKRANDLVQQIAGSDLFTPEQKSLAIQWEGHFIQLLNHPNIGIPAKAVCFLGIKVITPAIVLYRDNRLASDRLIPFVEAQRELLTLLLPEKSDVEGFIIQCEEVYNLMIETKMKLNDIIAMNKEIEQLIMQRGTAMREIILSNSNKSREMLRELAQQWKAKIAIINVKLTQLTEKADGLNKKFQLHAHELETIGTELASEQKVFQGLVEDLKNLLNKV